MKNMNTKFDQEPDAFAHGAFYLAVRRFVRRYATFLIHPWTMFKRIVWFIRYPTPASRFSKIHEKNYWSSGESLSGEGSTLEATRFLRAALKEFILKHDVKSILDVPCGDFNWMRYMELEIPYHGGDIVDAIVARNRENYSMPNRSFEVIDLTKSKLPHCDLVFTRDCLNHLSFSDIQKAISNIQSSGAKYLAVTQFPAQTINRNQESGFIYRELNFEHAPFRWKEPVAIYNEKLHPGKHIAFWKVSDLSRLS
jgi:hypothetical protein